MLLTDDEHDELNSMEEGNLDAGIAFDVSHIAFGLSHSSAFDVMSHVSLDVK